jgi:hypothetical protein
MSIEFMSIIGRYNTDDCPGWLPFCIICIRPDHPGLLGLNEKEAFQRVARLEVESFA